MKILLDDINIMISNIEEYIENQDIYKSHYVIETYKKLAKRSIDFGIDYISIENTIPDYPSDTYEIILSELKMLRNEISGKMENYKKIRSSISIKELADYIKKHNGIECEFGKINIKTSDIIGQGGNGCVYSGKINNNEVAVKFLIKYNNDKCNRFKSEYFNVNLVRDKLINIVNCIHYEELKTDYGLIPYIIMERYVDSLRNYRKKIENIKWQDVKKVFEFLLETLMALHKQNIIHRDIKPENILIDKNANYVLADFGIAHFENDKFPINNNTKNGDRLANFEFSAPEQIRGKNKITFASDIYSMAQVIYWFVFGRVHKGTGFENFEMKFKQPEAKIMSDIIYKCLQNKPENRYQSIDEIKNDISYHIDQMNHIKNYNPFDDMYMFSDIIRSINPDFYNNVSYIEDKKQINKLLSKISKAKFNRRIEFNTGIGNDTIEKIQLLSNGNFLINGNEIKIKRVWGSLSSNFYDDILILELDKILPYKINGNECYGVAVIENKEIIPIDKIESGYVKIDNKVYKREDLKIEERYINTSYKKILIGTFGQCTIFYKNDEYIEEIQNVPCLNKEIIINLKNKISRNKAEDVSMNL
ncbi:MULTISPECIES: serine/threonine-protein kinase [Clostridium]|uniref:serine/threonine-protein kinase n=1 Tax=Clostridium TaxID=1485 RepID=UPI0008245276|nr:MULTISPECIES: serine/threonine-protein kinase [Clostridium]PJI06560.1 serine/threonine protein kinase [Clostridium sp. CT7]